MTGVHGEGPVGAARDDATSVGLVGGEQIGDVEVRRAGQEKSVVDPVLDLLESGRFDHGHVEVLGEEAGIGLDLGRLVPGIVAHDHHGAALGPAGLGEVPDGEAVRRHVHADGFHDHHGPHAHDPGAVESRCGQPLVVGDLGHDADLVQVLGNSPHRIEHVGHG